MMQASGGEPEEGAPEVSLLACMITGIHRESQFRVGGSTICLDCGTKLTTCCEGAPQS